MDVLLLPYHSRLLTEWALDRFVTSFALVSLHSSLNLPVTPLITLPASLSSHFSPWSTQTLHHSLPLSHSWWCLSSCQCLCFSHNKPWSTTSVSSFWQQVLAHIWKDSKNQPLFLPFVEPSHFCSSPCCQSAIALTRDHVRIQKILITRFERKRSKLYKSSPSGQYLVQSCHSMPNSHAKEDLSLQGCLCTWTVFSAEAGQISKN